MSDVTTTLKSPLLRGKRRQQQLAAEAEIERQQVEAALIADLGRQPSASERIAIETLSAETVRARRMRQYGRHERAEMSERLVLRTLARLGGVTKPASKPVSIAEQLRARGYTEPETIDAEAAEKAEAEAS
jgi:hypothetical protein